MDSFLQSVGGSPRVTFTVDGVATDPTGNAVTVTIRKPDGTALVTAQTATRIAAGVYGYTLSGAQAADLGVYTAEWTGTLQSAARTLKTFLEIVGGFYFTTAEFKAAYTADSKVQALTTSQVQKARQVAEEIIEDACHVSFVPRAKRFVLSGEGKTRTSIPLYKARAIQSVTVDDVVQTVDDSYRVGTGAIYRTATWRQDIGNVEVVVAHGYDYPPERIKAAAIMLAFHRAIKGPIDDRATSVPAGEAGGVITLLTPGVGAAITGIPEVDAAIIAHRLPAIGSVSSVPTTDSANTYPSNLDTFAIG